MRLDVESSYKAPTRFSGFWLRDAIRVCWFVLRGVGFPRYTSWKSKKGVTIERFSEEIVRDCEFRWNLFTAVWYRQRIRCCQGKGETKNETDGIVVLLFSSVFVACECFPPLESFIFIYQINIHDIWFVIPLIFNNAFFLVLLSYYRILGIMRKQNIIYFALYLIGVYLNLNVIRNTTMWKYFW